MSDDKALTARDIPERDREIAREVLTEIEAGQWQDAPTTPRGVIEDALDKCAEYVSYDPVRYTDRIVAALDAAGYEITAKDSVDDREFVNAAFQQKNRAIDAERALAEAQQRIEAFVVSLARSEGGRVAALQRIEAVKAILTEADECGSGEIVELVYDLNAALSASTAPETETTPETRCYHPYWNALPDGRTECRTCGADTTHVDAMGG